MAYRVTVIESGIVRVIQVGDGHRWLRGKATEIKVAAVARAPMRTGNLKRSHRVDQNRDAGGRYQSGFTVSATAPYAGFVHGGTRGMPGRWAKLPGVNPNPKWGPTHNRGSTVVFGVRGQRAQPWMEQAAAAVLGV